MFSKAFRVKANSQMKNTERKNLKSKLLKNFTTLTENDIDAVFSNKETISVIKVITHANNTVTVYTAKKRPMIFEQDNFIYPTVYFLWQVPNLLPCFTTHPSVISKLSSGADLMLPGVIFPESRTGPSKYGKFQKGELVAVNTTVNKLPLAVGLTAYSSEDMYMAGGRGKCVEIIHILCDYLCKIEGNVQIPVPELGPPDFLKEPVEQDPNEKPQVEEEESEKENVEEITEPDISNEINEVLTIDENNTSSMDHLLLYCFLKAVKYSHKKLTYPILTSNFYRLHMITACPTGKVLDIKKTKYKKLNKFLAEMKSLGIVNLAEQTKGVETITSFNLDHPQVINFVRDSDDIPEPAVINSSMPSIDVVTSYVITAAVTPIFSEVGLRKGDSVKIEDLRKYVTKYIKKHKLQSVENPDMVIPNKDLIIIMKSELPQTWATVMERVCKAMSSSYQISNSGVQIHTKNKIEPIIMSISNRPGNKKVTLVDNLEVFGISITEFSKECQHGVATSTSISKPQGKKYNQLLVQGNQIAFIGKLLQEKYKIPKKFIRGLELAVKSKSKN